MHFSNEADILIEKTFINLRENWVLFKTRQLLKYLKSQYCNFFIICFQNIKRLLKIPYSKSHVSMMVHRVGDTLLLDDFDIHKHLLRRQEDDWQWLRKFYFETIVQQMHHDMKVMCCENLIQNLSICDYCFLCPFTCKK